MGLVDDLRAAASSVDPQSQPTSNELSGFVTALAAYVEHGDSFLKAAEDGPEKVTELLAGDGGSKAAKAKDKEKG